ncbi:MAG: YicC family protein [Clostridia bacterium]|nr:YicC family protein [Clostridia bacterium]
MTGYGRKQCLRDGREMTVEVKTVNHRFLDIAFRMPRSLGFLEDPIRKALSARMRRGHADVNVAYRNTRTDARTVSVDAALLCAYQGAFDRIHAIVGVGAQAGLSPADYARLPDVLVISEQEEDRDAVIALLEETLHAACDEMCAMRRREGEALREDMLEKLAAIEAGAAEIAERAPLVVRAYQEKLQARLAELLDAPVDPQRLAQEVALFADRCAIDEELVRLASHIEQMRAAFSGEESAGRRLDFLIQELNREINTIGSKASDLAVTTRVVDVKGHIEKLREQAQNIE